jgi:ribosomal protein S3
MAKRKLELYVFSVNNENIEAELLTRYIFIKFKQKYSINFMLYPIRRELIKLVKMRVLDGFRIRLSGRFNRRQRSKVITLNYGLLPLTQKSKNIDFNERTLVLRFSILSIRV